MKHSVFTTLSKTGYVALGFVQGGYINNRYVGSKVRVSTLDKFATQFDRDDLTEGLCNYIPT